MMPGTPLLATSASRLVLASVHAFSGTLRSLDQVPRSRWISFAGGVAVAMTSPSRQRTARQRTARQRTARQRAVGTGDHTSDRVFRRAGAAGAGGGHRCGE